MIFFLAGSCPLRADEGSSGDQEFVDRLNSIKSPFEDGLPKPVPVVVPPAPKPKPIPIVVRVKRIIKPPVKLPSFTVQGVIVGEGVEQAIINDQVLPVGGIIKGARIILVNKKGVEFLYKGKKFFLRVD